MGVAEDQAALIRYAPQELPDPEAWLTLVRTQVMGVDGKGNPRPMEDMLFFLNTCYRAHLDPLARQIYAVYRWDSRLGKEKMAVQVSIDGMRLIAQRSGAYGGQDDARYLPEDESTKAPRKASVTVYRLNSKTGERMPVTASARWDEYVPLNRDGHPSGMWSKMPYLMLAKVAEALALRKAFPQELSGLYTTEEMAQAGNELEPATILKPPQTRAPALVEPRGKREEPATSYTADVVDGEIIKVTITSPEDVDRFVDELKQDEPEMIGEDKASEPTHSAGNGNGHSNGNGKGKPATIDPKINREWVQASNVVAEQTTYYQKAGKPDIYHMLQSAYKLGYEKITADNLNEVVQKLLDNANEKTAKKAA